jgi:hypothetical protein
LTQPCSRLANCLAQTELLSAPLSVQQDPASSLITHAGEDVEGRRRFLEHRARLAALLKEQCHAPLSFCGMGSNGHRIN